MAGLYDMMLYVVSYSIIIFGIIFLLNFLTKGFILKYLRVKASRGAKSLVRVHALTEVKYRIGWVSDATLHYKEDRKTIKHLKAGKFNVLRELGINIFEVDEERSSIRTIDWRVSSGHNTDHFDGLLVRALQKPNLVDKTKETIMFFLQVVQTVLLGVALFLLYNISQQIGQFTGGAVI